MRVWDLSPGYLNDRSLLGEHRELHGIVSILVHRKHGYSRHPETLRWTGCGWALRQRHRLLKAEMSLRGFQDRTPVGLRARPTIWPSVYIDPPGDQYEILRRKYIGKAAGRIPLPRTTQELWAQHKYSVLARSPRRYAAIGKMVSGAGRREGFGELASELVDVLRVQPETGPMMAALQHMWRHVSAGSTEPSPAAAVLTPTALLLRIQNLAKASGERDLLASTALSELAAWIEATPDASP
jgi:hypothetical protein